MDEQRRQKEQEKEPELKRPHDTVEDLEPEEENSEAVKGGRLWSGDEIPQES